MMIRDIRLASDFLVPDSPLLVPAPFLSSVHLHGVTRGDFPLPLRQKPSLDSFRSNLKTFLFPKL